MKPTLFVLAAGMGSRYGGLKQLDPLGPQGQTIMDYSIYDAIQAGFGKVVFVIRKDFENDFREKILSKYEGIYLSKSCSSPPTSSPKATHAPLTAASHGALTMLCSWAMKSSESRLQS